jgi:hypothetical protein
MNPLFSNKLFVNQIPIEQIEIGTNEKTLAISILGVNETERINNYPFHLIVYINTTPQIPILIRSNFIKFSNTGNQYLNFKESLLNLPDINFNNILFLTTTYRVFSSEQLSMIPTYHPNYLEANQEMNEFFSNSSGYFLYSHQLEQLYCMLTGCNYMEAITFRKDWNLKKPQARAKADKIIVSEGISLAKLIQQRSIENNSFVYNADFGGAYRLWKYIIDHLTKYDA